MCALSLIHLVLLQPMLQRVNVNLALPSPNKLIINNEWWILFRWPSLIWSYIKLYNSIFVCSFVHSTVYNINKWNTQPGHRQQNNLYGLYYPTLIYPIMLFWWKRPIFFFVLNMKWWVGEVSKKHRRWTFNSSGWKHMSNWWRVDTQGPDTPLSLTAAAISTWR